MRYRETLPSRVSNNLRNYRTNQTCWSLLWYLLQSQANKDQHGEQNVQDRQKIKVKPSSSLQMKINWTYWSVQRLCEKYTKLLLKLQYNKFGYRPDTVWYCFFTCNMKNPSVSFLHYGISHNTITGIIGFVIYINWTLSMSLIWSYEQFNDHSSFAC